MKYTQRVGTRAEVMHGVAHHTSGGLVKKDLKYNPHGQIVSVKKSELGKDNPWIKACESAKSDLTMSGFVPIQGKVYKLAKKIQAKK